MPIAKTPNIFRRREYIRTDIVSTEWLGAALAAFIIYYRLRGVFSIKISWTRFLKKSWEHGRGRDGQILP